MSKIKIEKKNIKNIKYGDIIVKMHFDSETIFTFHLLYGYKYKCKMKWGDGSNDNINYFDETTNSNITHTYQSGDYYLKIEGLCETLEIINNNNLMEIVSWGTTNLKILNFNNSMNLSKLPNEHGNLKNVKNFNGTFYNCGLETIPGGLFKANSIATDYQSVFQLCPLKKIPLDLFEHNYNITNLKYAFNACSSLTGCAPDIWNTLTQVTNYDGCFANCSGLENFSQKGNCVDQIPHLWTIIDD